jgi:beta-lactamase regulating signal transducer with metallopeptidase domain
LLKAAQRRMPMTWGVLHPKVLLLEESREWPPDRCGVVLLHELVHAQRCEPFS